MPRKSLVTCVLWVGLTIALEGVGAPAAGAESEADAAENLVRAVHFEGVPYERAAALTDAGVARLIELLEDPDERAVHARVIEALGMSGHPGSFERLEAFTERGSSGAVDRAGFRARTALRLAMGYLAREDARAEGWLLRDAGRSTPAPWHFRRMGPQAVRRHLREAALTGLALSGSPSARDALQEIAEGRTSDAVPGSAPGPRLRQRAFEAIELHDRVAASGPAMLRPGGRHGTGRAGRAR